MSMGCVHTNRVESSPVQSDSQRRGSDSVTYSGSRSSAYTTAESSRAESHEFAAARSIFVSQTLVIGRDGCWHEEVMGVEKLVI